MTKLIEKLSKTATPDGWKRTFARTKLCDVVRYLNRCHRHALVDIDIVNEWYDPNDTTDPDTGHPVSYISYHLPDEWRSLRTVMKSEAFIRIRHIRIWEKHHPWDLFES